MKIALNGATTMNADLKTDIKAASEAGFDLIEIWASKLRRFLEQNSIEDLKTLLSDANLLPYSINSIEFITFRTLDEYEKIKAECAELSGIASEIACPYIVVVPGKMPANASKQIVIDESVKVLNELADIVAPLGVSLAFEFLGQTDCSVQTLDLCAEIVGKVNRKEVGLVLDSFHFYAGSSSFDAIDALDPEKLFIFHINDAEDMARNEMTDANRLYPGEGILPLGEIKRRLMLSATTKWFRLRSSDLNIGIKIHSLSHAKAREATISVLGLQNTATGGSW